MYMELIDILTPQGKPTGRIKSKVDIHRDGDWHQAVHLWIRHSNGDWLMQLRSPRKINDPNRWDISVAGHVSSGEPLMQALRREAEEELGIIPEIHEVKGLATLREDRTLNQGQYLDREFHHIFFWEKDLDLSRLKLQTEEVAEVKWVSTSELAKQVQRQDGSLVPHWEEYRLLLSL